MSASNTSDVAVMTAQLPIQQSAVAGAKDKLREAKETMRLIMILQHSGNLNDAKKEVSKVKRVVKEREGEVMKPKRGFASWLKEMDSEVRVSAVDGQAATFDASQEERRFL